MDADGHSYGAMSTINHEFESLTGADCNATPWECEINPTEIVCVTSGCMSYAAYEQAQQNAAAEDRLLAQNTVPTPADAQAQNKTGKQQEKAQQLKYNTVKGGPKAITWVIQWQLSKKSKLGGQIVQSITVTDASGRQIAKFWEAWEVPAGSRYTKYYPNPEDDTIGGNRPSGTMVNAEARFHEGLKLPSSLRTPPFGVYVPSGDLPYTTEDPHLSTNDATAPVDRTWTAP